MISRSAAFLAFLALGGGGEAVAAAIDFNRDIRPILSENCFQCHGADAAQRQAELRLDVRELAVEQGAIVPSDAAASSLVERVGSHDADLQMPPPDSQRRLTAEQIALLTRWVEEGAEYKSHWAFHPVRRPAAPNVALSQWPRNDVDRFVLAQLEEADLAPSKRAPLPALLRRVSFDLTGLPPSPAQMAAWQAGADPVRAAVDELLASPHFGERMAVDWLDVARYADTHGFNNDTARSMWRWRDWAVEAFNANMPYDRFIALQLAGDLLPEATVDDRLATGFNRNHVINSEGGIIDEEYRVEYVADRVRTVSLAWLGLTLECARCHDHKFDPLSQRDYYQMFAFFNSVDETGEDGRVANAAPLMRAPTQEQQRRYEELLEVEEKTEAELRRMAVEQLAPAAATKADDRDANAAALAATWKELEKQVAMNLAPEPLQFPSDQGVSGETTSFELSGGWTWMAWVRRDNESSAPLVSTMDFSSPPSSQGYGRGMEIGVADDGALDVRVAVRWPAYALNVRSADSLPVGRWSHVAVVGQGERAAGVRIFIDGVEAATEVRHDGLTGSVGVGGAMNVGNSGDPAAKPYDGSLQAIRLLSGVIDETLLGELLRGEVASRPQDAEASEPSWGRQLAEATARRLPGDAEFSQRLAAWKQARGERLALLRSFPTVMVVQDLPEPRATFVLERGQYDKPGAPVTPDVPAALGLPLPPGAPRDRVALARWFTDPRHPLTARVVVNRLWLSFFGVGLVKTVEDFGSQSEWPSHPELLDWLAADFMESGWDVKHLVRTIVESATYQQDSAATAERWAADPENRLLARGPRQRLTAEMLRDQALAVGGLLVPRLGGPPAYPYQPADLYKGIVVAADYPGASYQQSEGEELFRRSLYTFWKRTVPHPTMTTFDAPDREFCSARRSVTNTPLQALVLMNDPIFLEAARQLGARMLAEGGDSDQARLAWGFKLLTAREPEPEELAKLLRLLIVQREEFAGAEAIPTGLLTAGASPQRGEQSDVERAAYANVASLLLNLDEALTRN